MIIGSRAAVGWLRIARKYAPDLHYTGPGALRLNAPNREKWDQVWRDGNTRRALSAWYDRLAALYSEPQRHYHNFRHLAECLAELESARHLAREPMAVELAIWFHDAVYDPRAQDNEERSAELARRCTLEAGLAAALAESVTQLVLATKAHDASLHVDAPLVVDVDLSILGQPGPRFAEYERQIRRENAWVPAPTFASKRALILERFLARKRIYATELFFEKYEPRARTNLQNSLGKLKAKLRASAGVVVM